MSEGDKVRVIERPVTAHGWMKRPDIGPDVWELPDGRLFQGEPLSGVPRLATMPTFTVWTRGTP